MIVTLAVTLCSPSAFCFAAQGAKAGRSDLTTRSGFGGFKCRTPSSNMIALTAKDANHVKAVVADAAVWIEDAKPK